MLPLQFAAQYPKFLLREPAELQAGDFEWPPITPQMCQDRTFYLNCVKERAEEEGGIVEQYYRVLSRPEEARRHFWHSAVSRIDIHRAMASCDWDPPALGA